MTFEEVKPGQIIELNKAYFTVWLFVLGRLKSDSGVKLIDVLIDTSNDVIERRVISKLTWDEDYRKAETLADKEEISERRKNYIVFMWNRIYDL